MHQREVLAAEGGTFSDTMHLVFGGVSSIIFFVMLGFGAWAMKGPFRIYTIATVLLMVVFGTLMGMETPGVAEDEPTPWLGVYERFAIEGSLLWISVLAAFLLYEGAVPTNPPPMSYD
jgi:hypothetical protein